MIYISFDINLIVYSFELNLDIPLLLKQNWFVLKKKKQCDAVLTFTISMIEGLSLSFHTFYGTRRTLINICARYTSIFV